MKYKQLKQICNERIIGKIEAAYTAFKTDATDQAENGNKAAGTRACKAYLEIEKALKEFRKVSFGKL